MTAPSKLPEAKRLFMRNWRAANRDYANNQMREWRVANRDRVLLIAARKVAKKRGLPFNLELADVVIPQVCPVLGIALECGVGARTAASPSLDRIRPALGYVKGNVIVVSWRANKIKNDATANELRRVADFYEGLA